MSNTLSMRARFLNREVLGIACLSGASICATTLIVWACVTKGECNHEGPDACDSRKDVRGFYGNTDFYGLGIRLGIYFQWFASLLANVALDECTRRKITLPYVGFQIAVLAAALLLIFKSDCTFTAELIVVLYILLGGIFIVLAPEIVHSFRHVQWKEKGRPKYRLFSTFVWMLVGLVVPVSAWFWIRLAKADASTTDFYRTPGGTSMFLLAHIEDSSMKIASLFMAFWSLLLGLFALEKVALAFLYRAMGVELRPLLFMLLDIFYQVALVSGLLLKAALNHIITACSQDPSKSLSDCVTESLNLRRNLSLGDISETMQAEARWGTPEFITRLYVFVLAAVSISLSICAVELTLAWNNVSQVNSIASTGQIVPLIVGLATLVDVMWELSKMAISQSKMRREADMKERTADLYNCEACMWQSDESIRSYC